MAIVLFPKERKILEYLKDFIEKHGYSPTLKEIAQTIGVRSPATIHEHINNLITHGFLKRNRSGRRVTLEIVDQNEKPIPSEVNVPILGFIAAGSPLEPYTDPNARITLSSFLVKDVNSTFVLQVKGESMIEEGINDGDYVVIKYQETAQNGDIVVALLETGLATLKRFFKDEEKGQIKLSPANSKMSPIYATNVKIQGKVVGLIRKFN